jgi:hypothetical protein
VRDRAETRKKEVDVSSHDNCGGPRHARADLRIGKLPILRVVAVDSLVLHEMPDEKRWEPLETKIRSDGLLRHPPIAARDHGSSTHILLDGVNRVEALRRLGVQWLLLQEVDLEDDALVLSTWHHVAEGLNTDAFLEEIRRVADVSRAEDDFTPGGDFRPVIDRGMECVLVTADRKAYAVRAPDDPCSRLDVLTAVVGLIQRAANRDRVSYTNMADLARHYRDFSALVCYRPFAKTDVLELALAGRRFPSGVTRFSVPKRALYFDLPVAFLTGGGSVESKQAELDEMVTRKVREQKIRFYVEPTFIFDD